MMSFSPDAVTKGAVRFRRDPFEIFIDVGIVETVGQCAMCAQARLLVLISRGTV